MLGLYGFSAFVAEGGHNCWMFLSLQKQKRSRPCFLEPKFEVGYAQCS